MCASRLPSTTKAQMASGQGSHWLIKSPAIFHLCVTCPPEICVNFVFKHIHAASSYTICTCLYKQAGKSRCLQLHHKAPVYIQADCFKIIIIIINFYGAYILRNLSSEAQQNRIIKHNREQGCAKVIIRTRDN